MATTWELLKVQCTTIAGVVALGGNPRCASSGNITCNGTTCCANEKVVSHKCVAYPAGTTALATTMRLQIIPYVIPRFVAPTSCESHLCGMPCWQGNRFWLDLPSGRCRGSNRKHGGFCQKLGFGGTMQDCAAQPLPLPPPVPLLELAGIGSRMSQWQQWKLPSVQELLILA